MISVLIPTKKTSLQQHLLCLVFYICVICFHPGNRLLPKPCDLPWSGCLLCHENMEMCSVLCSESCSMLLSAWDGNMYLPAEGNNLKG